MTMGPGLRKLVLTSHVSVSVGWMGAVVGVMALAIAVLVSEDPATVQGAYLLMAPIARWVLVPLAVASVLTGLIQSLGTRWGLFRHYWVVFKLLINVFASVILVTYLETLDLMADMAAGPIADLDALRTPSPLIHGVGALLLLLTATVLSVYKPQGATRYGRRAQERQRKSVGTGV